LSFFVKLITKSFIRLNIRLNKEVFRPYLCYNKRYSATRRDYKCINMRNIPMKNSY
jgi:hypothetical protein